MADRIVLLKDSDILSESMHKINYNFKLLENDTAVNDYRWQQYVNSIDKKIDGLKNATDSRENALARNLDSLQDLIDSMATKEDIQNQINNALQNANDELRGFISTAVGQQVSKAYGTFATTSQLYEELGKLDYARSDAFDVFEAKVNERLASASRVVANSKFAEQDGHLVYTDNTVSPYTSLDDYWNSLDSATKASLDPQGKGLKDPEVLEAFMNYCERKFLTVYTELSAIRQIVGAGEANTEIMTAIKGPNGKDIVAAIFQTANAEGSGILMEADHIQLDGKTIGFTADNLLISPEHKLGLMTDTFIISANNLVLTEEGDLFLHNAQLDGDITAYSFKTPSGMTFMNSDGVLHASNAVIDGDITAKRFMADWSSEVNESINNTEHITGYLTKHTFIDGESFNIGVTGSLNTVYEGIVDTSGNSLYIKIANGIPNRDNNPDFGNYLYGVPVLCMKYNGVEYMLSPTSSAWFRPSSAGGDSSNMRFMPSYNAVHCTFNGVATELRNYCKTTTQNLGITSTVYIFRPNVTKSGKTFITMGLSSGSNPTDIVYQFKVLNWGTSDNSVDTTKRDMLNAGTKPLLSSLNPINGVYALQSSIGTEGSKFTGSGSVQTTVTPENRDAMISYLPKIGNYSLAYHFSKEITSNDDYNAQFTSDYGVDKIGQLLLRLLKYNNSLYSPTWLWKTNAFNIAKNGFGNGTYNCSLTRGNLDYNNNGDLESNLPFESSGTASYRFELDYYPISRLENYGKNHSDGVNQVIGNCKMMIYKRYNTSTIKAGVHYTDYDNSSIGTDDGYGHWYPPEDVNFYVESIDLTLEFNFALQFNSTYMDYDPRDSRTHQNMENMIIKLLKEYPYDDINSNNSNFANYLKLSGRIEGERGITVDIRDNFN